MTFFTKRAVLFLVIACFLFQSKVNAQSVMHPDDPIEVYPNGPTDPRPLPFPRQPENFNLINKWLRGNVKIMTGPAVFPFGFPWNSDAYKAYIYKSQPFRLKFPRTYDPNAVDGKRYPMVIFFHGLGEVSYNAVPAPQEDSLQYFLLYDNEWHLLWGAKHPFLDAVNNPGPEGYDGYILYMQLQIFGWDVQQYTALKEICDYMVINNKLDPFAVTASGLSGGATASWSMMTAYPSLISAAVPMSGASIGILNEINKFKFTPIWLFQGGNDPIQDENLTNQVVNGVNSAGGRLTYTFFPDIGHGSWQYAFNLPGFIPFIKNAYAANPWPLYGKTNFVTGETIAVTIGVAPGFDSYEWRRNDVIIPGANTNSIFVDVQGKYDVRVTKYGLQSEWSRIPANIFMNGSLLPVNWKSFTGNLVSGGINLNWEVDNNEQGKSYQVEHSTDGRNYSKVDEVPNKIEVKKYKYTYKTTEAGKHYFRILQIDTDGKSEYSKVVVIAIKGDANYSIRLVTNPVRVDFADLEINAIKQGRALIEIWSASGAKISSRQQQLAAGTTRLQVPLNGASAGLYMIKVQIGNALVTEKFIKF